MKDTSREVAVEALRYVYDRAPRLVSFESLTEILEVYTKHQFDHESADRALIRITENLVEGLSAEQT